MTMAALRRRPLEEMVYERLVAAVDPEPIVALGRDLDRSIREALVEPGQAPDPRGLKLAILRRALARLDKAICAMADTE